MKIIGIESSCDESAVCLLEVTQDNIHDSAIRNNCLSDSDDTICFFRQSNDQHTSTLSANASKLDSQSNDQRIVYNGSISKPEMQFLYTGQSITKNILAHYITTHNNHNYGGVIPESAARQHYYYLPRMIQRLRDEFDLSDVDIVCASTMPGLMGGLMMGSSLGKSVAAALNKPFYPIHHIEAHALSPLFEDKGLKFPYIGLIVSGGHTMLVHVEDFKKYHILGETADDAMGELFDKIAKYLGLPFPGGPEVEKLAACGNPIYKFTIPRVKSDKYAFSFSGLKTAMIRQIDEIAKIRSVVSQDMNKCGEITNTDAESDVKFRNSNVTYADTISCSSIHVQDNTVMQTDEMSYSKECQMQNKAICECVQNHNTCKFQQNDAECVNVMSDANRCKLQGNEMNVIDKIKNGFGEYKLQYQDMCDICASLQQIVVQVCVQKLEYIVQDLPHVSQWVMAGGVSANQYIRKHLETFAQQHNKEFIVPDLKLCTDNAIMIAWTGYLTRLHGREGDLNAKVRNYVALDELF